MKNNNNKQGVADKLAGRQNVSSICTETRRD